MILTCVRVNGFNFFNVIELGLFDPWIVWIIQLEDGEEELDISEEDIELDDGESFDHGRREDEWLGNIEAEEGGGRGEDVLEGKKFEEEDGKDAVLYSIWYNVTGEFPV